MRKKGIGSGGGVGGGGGVAVVEFGNSADMVVGVKTRAQVRRNLAMATSSSSSPVKITKMKRKFDGSPELRVSSNSQTRRRLVFPPESSMNSDQDSRCSSNGSSELVNERSGIDLESEELSSTCLNCRNRREDTASSSFREESNDNEPTEKLLGSEQKISPSEAEIEEFFATAEKNEQKRFAKKYNYDIAKDVPLKGRYEWIPMKP